MNHKKRVENVQEHLKKLGCEALLVDDVVNLYYLTGINLSTGSLLITQEEAVLLVDGRYEELCKKNAPMKVSLTPPTTVKDLLSGVASLGFNTETLSYKGYLDLKKQLPDSVKLMPLDNIIREMRGIKDPEEIALLREAGKLGAEGFDFVCTLITEGITEAEIATELEIFWKRKGSRGLAFEPIIAFGTNTSMPHYRAAASKLEQGQSIQIDIGVNDRHYHSDMSRVVFFGPPSDHIKAIYNIVLRAQMEALNKCRPGILVGDLDETARQIITKAGYGAYFTHSLGHGVGLEIHEYPLLRNKAPYSEVVLKPGMVITIEPGIYLPGIGGVRIEDTVVITDAGYEDLTNRPKELLVID